MKTLSKRPAGPIVEGGSNLNCLAFDTTWNPDRHIPFWAPWSAVGVQQATLTHLKHFPDAVLESPSAAAERRSRDLFEGLAEEWEVETEFISRQIHAVMHPAYQRIIGMGPAAVPLLLGRLRDNPDNWFWALTAITGEDPGKGSTTLLDAREAWLTWGQERGILF